MEDWLPLVLVLLDWWQVLGSCFRRVVMNVSLILGVLSMCTG